MWAAGPGPWAARHRSLRQLPARRGAHQRVVRAPPRRDGHNLFHIHLNMGAPPCSPGREAPRGAIPRADYVALVAKLDAVPALACPNFRLLAAQHPR